MKAGERLLEGLWESYREKKLGLLPQQAVEKHRDSFFAGATALMALFSAPFSVEASLCGFDAKKEPKVMSQWLVEICEELERHNRDGRTA